MRIQNIVFLSLAMIVFTGVTASRAQVDMQVSANFSELNDYGEWVIVPGYGTVWRPDAAPDWRPFTYGHWVYSRDGWVWDADEPFGWIVCHYGNWFYDDNQGWVWLPGNQWSPARVKWYVTDNEIGWAPLYPEPRQGYHQSAVHMQWTFAPVPFFTSVELHGHIAMRANPEAGEARVHVYAGPPRREFVQRSIRTPIVTVALNKVRVTTHALPLVRVEVQNRVRPNIEVPVGPKYKRVTVQSQSEQDKTVTVTHEQAARPSVRQEQSDNPRARVETRPTAPEAKVRVQTRDGQDNQNKNSDDNDRGKKKVKVEVHTR